jgi:hypothetical protein
LLKYRNSYLASLLLKMWLKKFLSTFRLSSKQWAHRFDSPRQMLYGVNCAGYLKTLQPLQSCLLVDSTIICQHVDHLMAVWLWLIKWERCGGKWPKSILKYYPTICLDEPNPSVQLTLGRECDYDMSEGVQQYVIPDNLCW